MGILFAIVLAYFLGSIPFSVWLGKAFRGIDLREYGSANPGATNAFRVLGKKIGITILCLDILKGLAAVIVIPAILRLGHGSGVELTCGIAAILGHVYSCWLNFHGGKGVATSLGVFLAIAPKTMTFLFILAMAIIGLTGYVSLASIVGAVLLPVFLYFAHRDWFILLAGVIVALMVIFRHQTNLMRLFAGKEKKLFDRDPNLEADAQRIPPIDSPDSPHSRPASPARHPE